MQVLRINAMDHIVLNVADVERALGFYCDVLGLPGERVEEFRKGEVGFPSVRINEHTLIDLQRNESRPQAGQLNLNHFCLITEPVDLEALTGELESKGVRIVTKPVSRWGARGRSMSIYILDPDDNQIEIKYY